MNKLMKYTMLLLLIGCNGSLPKNTLNPILYKDQVFANIKNVKIKEYDTLRYSKFAVTPILTLSDKIVYIDTLDGELKDLSIYIEQTYGHTVTPQQIFNFWNKYPTLEFKDSLSLDSANLIEFHKLVNHERILLRN